jgi:coenzyme F420 hydrogenase subunit beta
VCPGGSVDFNTLTQNTLKVPPDRDNYCGRYLDAYIGYSTDDEIRSGASSGGVATQLLVHLLESGRITGAIVVAMDEDNPLLGKAYIARSRQDLLPSRQSKYTVVPVNRILAGITKRKGTYALVCLPCQLHGFRKWVTLNNKLNEKVPIVIGLYCLTSFEPVITSDLVRIARIPKSNVTGFEFRGGEWPGHIRARDESGDYHVLHQSNFKDGAINYLTRLYSPERCKLCIDGSAELADISVADGWTRDSNGKYIYNRMSTMLVRTKVGQTILNEAVEAGALVVHSMDKETIYRSHIGLQRQKKQDAPARIERFRRKGNDVPEYDWKRVGTRKDRWRERLTYSMMMLGKSAPLRIILLKLLLSKAAVPLVWLRQWRKSRKMAG